jgi:hypothetical protein
MTHDGLALGKEDPGTEGKEEDPGTEGKDFWKRWLDNSPVIVGILSVAVVAIRLLGVSRGDPQIAYAILQAGGTGNVLIGTLVSTLGLLAIPSLAAFGFYTFKHRHDRSLVEFHVLLAGSLAMLYIALYMAPIDFLILGILEAVAAIAAARILEHREPKSSWDGKKILSLFICFYISVVLLFELASPTPWLPIQAISVAGQSPFSGYVLSQADGQTSILTYNPDGVINVPSQRVLATTQCTPHYYMEEQTTIVYAIERFINKLTNYPACPATRYSQSSQARGS